MEVEEILKKLIDFPTNNWEYDNNIKSFIITLFEDLDKEIINVPNTKERCFFVKLKSKKSSKKTIVFLCHMDTIVPSNTWKSKPLITSFLKNKVVGLGASDMKGSIASLIKAIRNLKAIERDIILIFTSDEETTVSDIKKLKKKLKLRDCIIIATEPTEGNIIIGQNGIIEIKITTFGKSSHASNADFLENEKNNAIYKIIQVMRKIREQEIELNKEKEGKYNVSTINMGKIYGGSAVNVMPDKCSLEVSYRLNPSIDIDSYFSKIITGFKKIDTKIKVDLLLKGYSFDSGNTDLANSVKSIIEKTIKKVDFEYGKSWSEIAELSKNNTCMIIGPGSQSQAHKADEYIDITKLNQFCQVYSDIITNV